MPRYRVTDAKTGRTLTLEGDSPPTESELAQIFDSMASKSSPLAEGRGGMGRPLPSEYAAAAAKARGLQREALLPQPSGEMRASDSPEAQTALESIGMIGGGLVGSTGGPAGAVAGAGLGLAGARKLGEAARIAGGARLPARSTLDEAMATIGDVNEGAAGEMLGPVVSKGIGQLRLAAAAPLSASAEKSAMQAIAYGGAPKAIKAKAERVVPEILDRPMGDTFAVTKAGMKANAEAGKEAAGEAINATGTLTGKSDPSRIVKLLEAEKAKYVVDGGIVDPKALGRIEEVQNIFAQYGDSISDEGLRNIRRLFDKEIARGKGFVMALDERSLLDIKKTASDEIRGILAEKYPDLAKLNKQFNFWSNLDEVLDDTVQRTKPHRGLVNNLATIGGAVAGYESGGLGKAALLGGMFRAVSMTAASPGWKLTSARVKNAAAKALTNGDPKALAATLRQVDGYDKSAVAMLTRMGTVVATQDDAERVDSGLLLDAAMRQPGE